MASKEGTVLRNWLSALRALAWVVSPLSCGIVQQGVGPRGSAGARIEVVFEVPPCHSKETQQALLTGCWPLWFHTKCGMWEPCNCRDRENMKPFEGKHETLSVRRYDYMSLPIRAGVNYRVMGQTFLIRTEVDHKVWFVKLHKNGKT